MFNVIENHVHTLYQIASEKPNDILNNIMYIKSV